MHSNKHRNLLLLLMGGAALLSVSSANAIPSRATTITNFCSSNGYTLLPEYQNDTCDAACHNNPPGVTAFNNGDYEYFCPAPTATCTDADNDGYFAEGGDCGPADFNDNNPDAYPGAPEICTDGVDNDGNGLVDANDPGAIGCSADCTDIDGDGYSIEGGSCGAIDCNDADSEINPGATEVCTDNIDNNCNGAIDTADTNAVGCPTTCTDLDGDGYSSSGGSCGPVDCNDGDATINPGAAENCGDGIDNDCNGRVDSADSVCQTGNECETKWWRKKDRHHHDDENCDTNGGGSDDDDDDDDDGGNTGGGNGGSTHAFGWTNPTASHPDYVDDNGVSECTSCHSIDPADKGSPTSCFNCHGQEWDDTGSGGGNGGATHPFGWTNPTASHPDYVDDNGVSECTSCHSIDPADAGSPTSCYNCHGQEWDNAGSGGGNDDDENEGDNRRSRKKRDRSDDD